MTYPEVPKMQRSARFVNNCHYSVKQWHTLTMTISIHLEADLESMVMRKEMVEEKTLK